MDLSGEVVADIHMRTDAKNIVTTARTIHIPEQEETTHMISMLSKEASSRNIHDLAPIPTQNCLADCLTKASAKADNLITAVKTGRLLNVEIQPILEHSWNIRLSYLLWCRTCMHTKGEGCFLLECFEDFSRTDSTRRTIPFDVFEKSTYPSIKRTTDVRLESLVVKCYWAN